MLQAPYITLCHSSFIHFAKGNIKSILNRSTLVSMPFRAPQTMWTWSVIDYLDIWVVLLPIIFRSLNCIKTLSINSNHNIMTRNTQIIMLTVDLQYYYMHYLAHMYWTLYTDVEMKYSFYVVKWRFVLYVAYQSECHRWRKIWSATFNIKESYVEAPGAC